jgi:glycosyltransferase involved in cell wall biosynthesis
MNDFDISVIIPTSNRADLLEKVLGYFVNQTYPLSRFEVIVIDDGSVDNTESLVKVLQNKMPYKLGYIKQENQGPAAARNKGLTHARSDIVLFMGDDTLPTRDLIEQHLESHRRDPGVAVLGFTDWSKELEITDFMHYIAPNGLQFRYGNIKDSNNCDFRHFYTSNISLSKKWLTDDQFDEEFPFATLEDTELAYRLKNKGLKIIFNKNAISYHYHHTSLESFCQRMKLTGFSAVIFIKKHPEFKANLLPVNISLARIIAEILRKMSFLIKINRRLYWLSLITIAYIEGFNQAMLKKTINSHRE